MYIKTCDIIIFIESASQERQVLPESFIINNTESTGKCLNNISIFSHNILYHILLDTNLSIHAKRSLNEETNESVEYISIFFKLLTISFCL